MTTTKRSLDHLRKSDWTCAVVERWNAFSKRKNDLFGFADILCINSASGFLAVQTTSQPNAKARIDKILAEPRSKIFLLAGGRIIVHGWKKPNKRSNPRWSCHETEVTLEMYV